MIRIARAAAVLGLRMPTDGRGRFILVLTLFAASAVLPAAPAYAASLSNASVSLSSPIPSATANYTFTASGVTTGTSIKCMQVVFSTAQTGGSVPTGLSTSGVTLDSSATNYVTTPSNLTPSYPSNGTVQFTASSAQTVASTGPWVAQFDGVTNSSVADTGYYMFFSTYTDASCTTQVDQVVVMFINTNGSTLSATINESLSMSISGVAASTSCDGSTTTAAATASTLPFGTVTSGANGMLCQQVSGATNGTNGFTVYLRYTGQPQNASGATIADVSSSNASPAAFPALGTEAFGYTTSDSALSNCSGSCNSNRFTDGSTYNYYAAATTSNAEVAYAATGASAASYYVGTRVGISTTTPAGNYTTTLIYTCTPIY